jgi:hypothetical protein
MRVGTAQAKLGEVAAPPVLELVCRKINYAAFLASIARGSIHRDKGGLLGLRDLAPEVDVQEPVLKPRTCYLEEIGELNRCSNARAAIPRQTISVGCSPPATLFSPTKVRAFSFTSIERSLG